MTEKQKTTKISVVGLDNAGKTSLIKTLFRTYNIGESLKPTKNVERTQFRLWGSDGGIWDFGGQEVYRQNYLEKPVRYFSEIKFLFFVIDVQDKDRFSKAIEYFKKVYEHSHSFSHDLSVIVLFHKFDPEVESEEITTEIENMSRELRIIVEDRELIIFKTSIYDPISILEAFSKPLLGTSPIYSANSVLFANFAMNHDVEYLSLIIDDLFELGSFRIRNDDHLFIKASMEFYQQFANVDVEDKQAFELDDYRFIIYKGSYEGYKYTLNLCISVENEGKTPSESKIKELLMDVDNNFQKYKPKFY